MISSLIVATLLTQFVTAATNQENGALNALYSTAVDVKQGTRTITRNAAKTRACVKFAGDAAAPGGSVTVRAGVVIVTPKFQQGLGLNLPPGATSWDDAPEMYGAMEVQAVPSATLTADLPNIFDYIDFIREEVEVRASPVDATCEVGFVRVDDAAISAMLRCACAVTSACKDAGGVTAAPSKITLSPGTFTPSAACQPKSCVGRFDGAGVDNTWPAVCPR